MGTMCALAPAIQKGALAPAILKIGQLAPAMLGQSITVSTQHPQCKSPKYAPAMES